jgi:hypothetical protein
MLARKFGVLVTCLALVLSGCAQNGNGSQSGSTDWGSTISKTVGGLIGAGVGAVAAEKLAESEGKRRKLSRKEIDKLKRGYMITFALLGAAGGAALAGTIYGKLSEQGRKQREEALVKAAQQAKPQRYGDPADPTLTGVTNPGKRYTEVAANRECVDVEDTLADAASKDAVFAKLCRDLPSGSWQEVTA